LERASEAPKEVLLNFSQSQVIAYVEILEKSEKKAELAILYEDFPGIGCEKLILNFTSPECQITRKIHFFSNEYTFVEYDSENDLFYAKTEDRLDLYDRSSTNPFKNIELVSFLKLKYCKSSILTIEEIVQASPNYLPIDEYNIKGEQLGIYNIALQSRKEIEILEYSNHCFFFKQSDDELFIMHLLTGEFKSTKNFSTPLSIEFLETLNEFACLYPFGMQI